MKRTFVALLLSASVASAATVTNFITDSGGIPLNTWVTFYPTNTPQIIGITNVLTLPVKTKAQRGVWSQVLVGGIYGVDQGYGTSPVILVPPDDTNIYSFYECAAFASNAITTFSWTNSMPTISHYVLPGSLVSFETNSAGAWNETITISASAIGLGSAAYSNASDFITPAQLDAAVGTNITLNASNGIRLTFSDASNVWIEATNSAGTTGTFAAETYNIPANFFKGWNATSLVLSNNNTYDSLYLRCATSFKQDGKIYLLYGGSTSLSSDNQGTICAASGTSWDNLTKLGTVFNTNTTGWDSGQVQGPNVMRYGGTNYMYYFGGETPDFEQGAMSIGVATSTDGTNWTRYAGNPLLVPTNHGAWTTTTLWRPYVFQTGESEWHMFYNAVEDPGPIEKITFATAAHPLGPWTAYTNFVLAYGTTAADPCILKGKDASWYMVYACNATGVRTAWSVDLTNWVDTGIVTLSGLTNYGADSNYRLSPYLVNDDSGVFMLLDDRKRIYSLRPEQSLPSVGAWYGTFNGDATGLTNAVTSWATLTGKPEVITNAVTSVGVVSNLTAQNITMIKDLNLGNIADPIHLFGSATSGDAGFYHGNTPLLTFTSDSGITNVTIGADASLTGNGSGLTGVPWSALASSPAFMTNSVFAVGYISNLTVIKDLNLGNISDPIHLFGSATSGDAGFYHGLTPLLTFTADSGITNVTVGPNATLYGNGTGLTNTISTAVTNASGILAITAQQTNTVQLLTDLAITARTNQASLIEIVRPVTNGLGGAASGLTNGATNVTFYGLTVNDYLIASVTNDTTTVSNLIVTGSQTNSGIIHSDLDVTSGNTMHAQTFVGTHVGNVDAMDNGNVSTANLWVTNNAYFNGTVWMTNAPVHIGASSLVISNDATAGTTFTEGGTNVMRLNTNGITFSVPLLGNALDLTNATGILAITAQQTNQTAILALTAQQTNTAQLLTDLAITARTNAASIIAIAAPITNAAGILAITAAQTNAANILAITAQQTNTAQLTTDLAITARTNAASIIAIAQVITNAPTLTNAINTAGTIVASGHSAPTNTWAINTDVPFGGNLIMTSGAATGGITGISGFPTTSEGWVQLTVLATGDIVFTNPAAIKCSDYAASRTITNGNFAVIAIDHIAGRCTNMAIVQFK